MTAERFFILYFLLLCAVHICSSIQQTTTQLEVAHGTTRNCYCIYCSLKNCRIGHATCLQLANTRRISIEHLFHQWRLHHRNKKELICYLAKEVDDALWMRTVFALCLRKPLQTQLVTSRKKSVELYPCYFR